MWGVLPFFRRKQQITSDHFRQSPPHHLTRFSGIDSGRLLQAIPRAGKENPKDTKPGPAYLLDRQTHIPQSPHAQRSLTSQTRLDSVRNGERAELEEENSRPNDHNSCHPSFTSHNYRLSPLAKLAPCQRLFVLGLFSLVSRPIYRCLTTHDTRERCMPRVRLDTLPGRHQESRIWTRLSEAKIPEPGPEPPSYHNQHSGSPNSPPLTYSICPVDRACVLYSRMSHRSPPFFFATLNSIERRERRKTRPPLSRRNYVSV